MPDTSILIPFYWNCHLTATSDDLSGLSSRRAHNCTCTHTRFLSIHNKNYLSEWARIVDEFVYDVNEIKFCHSVVNDVNDTEFRHSDVNDVNEIKFRQSDVNEVNEIKFR